MNKGELTVLIPETKQQFNDTFPNSEEIIRDTEVVILLNKNREAKRIAVFESCGVPVREDAKIEGEAVIGTTKNAVIIYASVIKSPSRFKRVLWHELGHVYSYVVNRKLYLEAEDDLRNNLDTPIRSGMSVWSEFIAEFIAYMVEDGRPANYLWPVFKKLEAYMDEAVNSGRLNVYPLAFFCAMAFGDPSVVAWSNAHNNAIPGFDNCDDIVIPLVGSLLDALGKQLQKDDFVCITPAKLKDIGKNVDILWDYCENVGSVKFDMERLLRQGK